MENMEMFSLMLLVLLGFFGTFGVPWIALTLGILIGTEHIALAMEICCFLTLCVFLILLTDFNNVILRYMFSIGVATLGTWAFTFISGLEFSPFSSKAVIITVFIDLLLYMPFSLFMCKKVFSKADKAEGLSYIFRRKTLRKIALESDDKYARLAALKKLKRYAEEQEILRQAALNDCYEDVRLTAVKKLPYPQEQNILRQIAVNDNSQYVRSAAVEKLPYPQERDILRQVAVNDSNYHVRLAAVEKLPYPQERDILRQIAVNDSNCYVRLPAVEKLPYSQERDILRQIAVNDSNCYVRLPTAKKLQYPQDEDIRSKVLPLDPDFKNYNSSPVDCKKYGHDWAIIGHADICTQCTRCGETTCNHEWEKSGTRTEILYESYDYLGPYNVEETITCYTCKICGCSKEVSNSESD